MHIVNEKDFRVGNYVTGHPIKTVGLNKEGWVALTSGSIEAIHMWSLVPSDILIRGIKLSEKWLKRFGFEYRKEDGGWWKVIEYEYSANNVYLCVDIHTGKNKSLASIATLKSTHFSVECEFVHQLQNLYYCLKNEELKPDYEKVPIETNH